MDPILIAAVVVLIVGALVLIPVLALFPRLLAGFQTRSKNLQRIGWIETLNGEIKPLKEGATSESAPRVSPLRLFASSLRKQFRFTQEQRKILNELNQPELPKEKVLQIMQRAFVVKPQSWKT